VINTITTNKLRTAHNHFKETKRRTISYHHKPYLRYPRPIFDPRTLHNPAGLMNKQTFKRQKTQTTVVKQKQILKYNVWQFVVDRR